MSAPSSSLQPLNNVIPRTAIITEGGGQRGIFTAGVLDTLIDKQFNPFEILIGTSAGAQNLSSYVAGQKGYARKTITDLTKDKHFFKLSHLVLGGNTVDLDWYFKQVKESKYRLDIESALNNLDGRQLFFSATQIPDYQARYFKPERHNWLKLLKASSALPFFYRQGVEINGEYYVDGGLSAPIPVEQAYHLGAKLIVVIRTVPHEHHNQSHFLNRIKYLINKTHHCPKPVDYFIHNEDAYDSALAFIDRPPEDVKIIEIHPQKTLASKILGSHNDQLETDYQAGKTAALDFLQKHHLDFERFCEMHSKTYWHKQVVQFS